MPAPRTVATDVEIYQHLLGDVSIGDKIFSPLPGSKGNSPSFHLFESEDVSDEQGNPIILWMDFSGRQKPSNAIKLLMEITGLRYNDAVSYADNEIAGKGTVGKTLLKSKESREMEVVRRTSFLQHELDYYKRFNITQAELESNGVFPVRKVSFSEYTAWYATEKNPMFCWKIGDFGKKLYAPLSKVKANKWRSVNVPKDQLDGTDFLASSNEIVIGVSARKDRMVTSKMVPSINPHGSESELAPWEACIEDVMQQTKFLLFLYDGDHAGSTNAAKIVGALDKPGVHWMDTRPYYERLGEVKVRNGQTRLLKDIPEVVEYFGMRSATGFYQQVLNDFGRFINEL